MAARLVGSASGDAALAYEELRDEAQKTNAMLCEVMGLLEGESIKQNKHLTTAYEVLNKLPPEIKEWWRGHKRVDNERKEKERKEKERKAAFMH